MSDLDADRDRQGGRSTTLVVVLALVFLTVLGASVGVILAKSDKAEDTASPPYDSGSSSAPAQASAAPSKSAGGGGYPATTKDQCPKQMKDETGISGLTVVRSVVTEVSEVWVCKSPDNKVFYQGHMRGKPFPAAVSDYSICLPNVARDGDAFVATNTGADGKTTRYHVGRDYLKITQNGSEISNERSTDRWGD